MAVRLHLHLARVKQLTHSINRDFLLFMPTQEAGLRAVLSYYTSAVRVNPEGDVHLSDETIQGLGTKSSFLTTYLFGAITQIASSKETLRQEMANDEFPGEGSAVGPKELSIKPIKGMRSEENAQRREVEALAAAVTTHRIRSVLTQFVPAPGYFLAGGLSGVVSRTITAPLDRLKVYLIAQTGPASDAVEAAKKGNPLKATRHGTSTIVTACKELWAAGGVRSLFAGKSFMPFDLHPLLLTRIRQWYQHRQGYAGICGQVWIL